MDRDDRRLLAAACVSAAVLVLSIVVANVKGELSEVAWLFVVPIGMLGAFVVCAASLGTLFVRRAGHLDP
jgi:hypothetical protein